MRINRQYFMGGILLSGLLLSACSAPDVALDCDFPELNAEAKPVREIALVLSPSDQFVDFDSALAATKPLIAEIAEGQATKLTVVLGDGRPRIISNQIIDTTDSVTSSGKEQVIEQAISLVENVSQCVEEEEGFATDEIDTLGAIQKAATAFSSSETDKFLVVLGNGLQTTGAFDFKEGLSADTGANEVTVNDLVNQQAAGDLSGVKVSWIGLGQTRKDSEQQPLDEKARTILIDFWKRIVSAAGGNPDEIVAGNVGEGARTSGGIPTSVVPFDAVQVCIEPIKVSSDDGFEFMDDVAIFKDEGKAKVSATEIKTMLDSAECLSGITVTGYVASGGTADGCARLPGFGDELSLQRANAFKSLLEQAGVSIQITAEPGGLGEVPDCVDGVGVEELMKQNRIAVITERK
jgi:hypothetical protein